METLYKILAARGKPFHGGSGAWSLPRGKRQRPGKWMPHVAGIHPCQRGYHLCRANDLLQWLGPEIWVAEVHPAAQRIDCADKIVVSRARLLRRCSGWADRTAREFAADCAERVLPLYERTSPGDTRVRDCIAVVRRFAQGEATAQELAAAGAAAWAAAGAAARAAAGAAARDAARAAAWDAAWAAARDAARAAAWDAAWAAAGAAAWAAERRWQTVRLLKILESPHAH